MFYQLIGRYHPSGAIGAQLANFYNGRTDKVIVEVASSLKSWCDESNKVVLGIREMLHASKITTLKKLDNEPLLV